MVSKAKLAASNRYVVRKYETISTRSPRSARLGEQIAIAADRVQESKAGFILHAIHERLKAVGISADDLPPVKDE